MAMNTQKIIVGGLAAGVVLNIIDWLGYGVILADRMKAELEAFKPGLSEVMSGGRSIAMAVVTDFVIGILLVWTYAAIRPRFGPGPSTAAAACGSVLVYRLAPQRGLPAHGHDVHRHVVDFRDHLARESAACCVHRREALH